LVADFGVGEVHATGKTRFSGSSATNCETVGKFFVWQSEKRRELLMSESADLKVHGALPFQPDTSQGAMAMLSGFCGQIPRLPMSTSQIGSANCGYSLDMATPIQLCAY
jgi:hypothetical protein